MCPLLSYKFLVPHKKIMFNVNQMDKGKQLKYWFMLYISRGLHAHDAEKQKKGSLFWRFINPKMKLGLLIQKLNTVAALLVTPIVLFLD